MASCLPARFAPVSAVGSSVASLPRETVPGQGAGRCTAQRGDLPLTARPGLAGARRAVWRMSSRVAEMITQRFRKKRFY